MGMSSSEGICIGAADWKPGCKPSAADNVLGDIIDHRINRGIASRVVVIFCLFIARRHDSKTIFQNFQQFLWRLIGAR